MRNIMAFIAAWVFFIVIGVTIMSQFVISEVINMGLVVPFATRVDMTLQDIMGMAPLFGAIFGVALIVALLAGSGVKRFLPTMRTTIYVGACFIAIAVALIAMRMAFNITAIAGTRDMDGFLALCVVGGLSGYVFSKLSHKKT